MTKAEPYGFEIIYFRESRTTWYEIRDLSSSEPVFEVKIEGTRKPVYYLQNTRGKDLLVLRKLASRSNVYRFFKDEIRYATFSYSTSCCNTGYEIQTENEVYIGYGHVGKTFQFVRKNGKVSFEIYKGFKGFKSNILVEVFESINPEIAILIAILLDQLARRRQSSMQSQMHIHHHM